MSAIEVVWFVVAAVLAMMGATSLTLGVIYLLHTDSRKLGLRYLGLSALSFILLNGWNWLMGK